MNRKTSGEMIDSVWLKPAKPSRGVPLLSQEKIVQTAIRILDADGQDGLTMRKLAEQLGAGVASLYWHVETRDEVLELALDCIIGEVALPEQGTDWQAELVQHLQNWRQILLNHHWAPVLIGYRPLLGPHALARSEFLREVLKRGGLTDTDAIHAGYTLSNFMIGAVITQVAWLTGGGADTRNRVTAFLQERAVGYPNLSAQMASEDGDWDKSFTRGLGWIIQALLVSAVCDK